MITLQMVKTCLGGFGPEDPDAAEKTVIRTDSRLVGPGDVFFCIPGERFDGHAFAKNAVNQGAALVVSSRIMPEMDPEQLIMVQDTVAALGRLAFFHRQSSQAKVAAVTGSAGKTTVKEMIATILARQGSVARNKGNFNNQIGLPVSMLEATGKEKFWVMEVGISKSGDMDELGSIIMPDVAVITNVGLAHTAGLGGFGGVVKSKARLLDFLTGDKVAVVCADYPELMAEAKKRKVRVEAFSTKQDTDVRCFYRGVDSELNGVYSLAVDGTEVEFSLPVAGGHFAESIAASAMAARVMGASMDDTVEGIAKSSTPAGRFSMCRAGELNVIDDSYNANPLSLSGAAAAARDIAGGGDLVFIVGDMLELGDDQASAHAELGRTLAGLTPKAVFFHGKQASNIRRGLDDKGYSGCWCEVDAPEQVLSLLGELNLDSATILVKGSRSCRMERYATALKEHFSER